MIRLKICQEYLKNSFYLPSIMNIEDFDDSDSSEDLDYHPEGLGNSGSESVDEKDEGIEFEENTEEGTKRQKKRKKVRKQGTKRTRLSKVDADDEKDIVKSEITTVPEDEKKRVDALWADFLGGSADAAVDDRPKNQFVKKPIAKSSSSIKNDIPITQQQPKLKTDTVANIFEFAGEKVEISNSQNEQSNGNTQNKSPPMSAAATKVLGTKRPAPSSSSSGLSSVLNQLSKKNKLSVLEKTKLDWDGFKSKEGIKEELQTHNRGREG